MDIYIYLVIFVGSLAFIAMPIFSSLQANEAKCFEDKFLAFRVRWIRKYYPELTLIEAYTIVQELPMEDLYQQIGLKHLSKN